jgi:prophage regulatory protein
VTSHSDAFGHTASACNFRADFNPTWNAATFWNHSGRASSPTGATARAVSESRYLGSLCAVMTTDMLRRLESDPGSRTIGELLQERAWAVNEILQLRSELQAFRQRTRFRVARQSRLRDSRNARQPPSDPNRMLTVDQVCAMVELSRASIYNMMKKQLFPAQVKIGQRCARWRLSDLISWQSSLKPSKR